MPDPNEQPTQSWWERIWSGTPKPPTSGGVPVSSAWASGQTVVPVGTVRSIGGREKMWNGKEYVDLGPDLSKSERSIEDEIRLRQTPTFSSSTSVSYRDPAELAIERQRAATMDAWYAGQLDQNARELALKQQTFDFNKSKEAFAQSMENKKLEAQAQQQGFQNQMSIVSLQTQRAQLQSQRDQFNAEMAMKTAQANMQYQAEAQNRLQQATRDIAQLSASPTDYGKLAAFLTANQRFGGAAATQGQDFRTPQSTAALGSALGQAQTAQQQTTQAPYGFTPLPAMAPIDLSTLSQFAVPPKQTATPTMGAVGPYAPQPLTAEGAAPQANMPAAPTREQANAALQAAFGGNAPAFVGGFADGGIANGAYIGDEEGSELHIPLGPGQALVIPHDKLANMSEAHKKALKKMADGGVFSGGNIITGPNTTNPMEFLNQSVTNALSGTPWAAGGAGSLPSAVYASSPGVSPLVTQLLGGISAMAGGLPASEYARQADILSPLAYVRQPVARQTPVGRTA